MRFVANLRNETIGAFAEQGIQPAAYLLSSHRISPATLAGASKIRELGLGLFADNGTKPLIDATLESFKDAASSVRDDVKAIRRAVNRIPRGKDIPSSLRQKADELAEEVVDHATALSEDIDSDVLLTAQLSMDPTDIIAQEDFATACLIGLDLERETTGWPVSRFDTRNRRSLRLWRSVVDDPRCEGRRVYAVLSAMDYNTARSAGRLAARAGVRHAALGIAGITRDPSATDFFVMQTSTIPIRPPVPRRYVRLAQILRGLADGFGDVRGSLQTFHCLGLGAPPPFPIAALAMPEATQVTMDATSPIHDAVRDRVLYDPQDDGNRISTRKIVARIVNGGDWPFLSPFSRAFRKEFGHDADLAREAWDTLGRPPITEQLLAMRSALTDHLPLFSEADPGIRAIAAKTWIAHNHWVLGQVAEALPDDATRHQSARKSLDRWLSKPSSVTTRGLAAALQVLMRPTDHRVPTGRLIVATRIPGSPRPERRLTMEDKAASSDELQRAALVAGPGQRTVNDLVNPLVTEAAELAEAVSTERWPEVAELGSRCLGLGYAAARLVQGEAAGLRSQAQVLQAAGAQLAALIAVVAKGEDKEEFFGKLRDRLAAVDPDTALDAHIERLPSTPGAPAIAPELLAEYRQRIVDHRRDHLGVEESLDKLISGETRGVPLLEAMSSGMDGPCVGGLVAARENSILCLCRGLMAVIHAEFNLALPLAQARTEAVMAGDLAGAARGLADELAMVLREHQIAVYGALVARRPDAETARLAYTLAGELEQRLPAFAHLQAALHASMTFLRGAGKGGASERIGRVAARCNMIAREAIACHAAGYRLALEVAGPAADEQVLDLAKRARELAFDGELPDGKNTELARLNLVEDGAFVEIEGFADSVTTSRSNDGKLISHLKLLDPSSGATVDAAAVFVHLPHAGLTKGAFCRLSGHLKEESALSSDGPVVEVHTLSLAELAEESWRIAFVRSAERWFQPRRNGANIVWSLGPHHRAPDEGIELIGAGELLFLPLVRR